MSEVSSTNANEVHIGNAIDSAAKLSSYQIWIAVLIALVFAADGIANVVLPVAIPSIGKEWGLGRDAFKFVIACGLTGVAIGAAFGGIISDKLGRRWALICCVMLFGVMTALSSLSNSIEALAAFRFFDGLGIGGAVPIGMALLAESMNVRRRSLCIALSMGCLPIGSTIASALSPFILPDWKLLFLIGGLIPIALAIAFIFVLPESPRFLVLNKSRWGQLRKLMNKYKFNYSEETAFTDVFSAKQKVSVSALFAPEFKTNTLIIWLAFFFCFVGSYSMFSWGPTMMMSSGFSLPKMGLGMSVLSISGIVGSFFSGLFIERFGSRTTVFIYNLGSIVGALACAIAFTHHAQDPILPLVTLGVFGFFIAGVLNVNYTMGANLYPPYIKGTGIGSAASIGRVGAVISSFTGVAALNYGGAMTFFIAIICCYVITMIALAMIRNQINKVA